MWYELINTSQIQGYALDFQINNNLIIIFSYISIISALCVIFSRNAIVSIIYLILLYVNVSIYLYYTGLGLIGLLYILVYVGAIAILFLFILSLINIKMSELSISLRFKRWNLKTNSIINNINNINNIKYRCLLKPRWSLQTFRCRIIIINKSNRFNWWNSIKIQHSRSRFNYTWII